MRLVESTKEEDLKVEIIYLEPNKNTGLWTVPQEAILIDLLFALAIPTNNNQ